ncbi:MAG: hypothetical protein IJJ99_10170 [Oscillospiraceae bacterium]|nr:hypothetical protein [Oscillospiraceae bacterium]
MTQTAHAKQIKKMYAASILWAAAILLAVFGTVVGIYFLARMAWIPAAVFLAMCLVSVAVMLLLRLHFRSRKAYRMLQVKCPHGNLERLVDCFNAKPYADDLYEGRLQRNGACITVDIVQTDTLQESNFKEIRSRLKRTLPRREQKVGLFSAGKYARVRLIVCKCVTAQALDIIAESTEKNLDRTECLFYAVLSMEDAALYYPDVYDGLEYLQVKRYAAFCDMMTEAVL